MTDPPLTTIVQPTEQKGELAAKALLEALELDPAQRDSEAVPARTILPLELLVRGTTAPPPG
jgi:DNA-binding LacI/PurR family transcriptional regulator